MEPDGLSFQQSGGFQWNERSARDRLRIGLAALSSNADSRQTKSTPSTIMTWFNLIVLSICAVAACPAITAVFRQVHAGKPKNRFYEDADGRSTPEAVARYSSTLPKTAILFFAVIGAGTSISSVILSSVDSSIHLKGADNSIRNQSLLIVAWVRALHTDSPDYYLPYYYCL